MPVSWTFEGSGLYSTKATIAGVDYRGVVESRVCAKGWDWEVWQPGGDRVSGFALVLDEARGEAERALAELARRKAH